MKSAAVRYARLISIIALAVGYALLAHYTNTTPGVESLGTLVALAPIMLALWSVAWHARYRTAMLIAFGLVCAGVALQWDTLTSHYDHVYWLEHAGTEAFLCVTFARSLRSGREPMCTYFARAVHGSLTPALERYTRQITVAWVMFFGSMAAVSTVLFFIAPLNIWSAFANFFTAPLIISMFVIEYLVRRHQLPDMEHVHIVDGIKAFWKASA